MHFPSNNPEAASEHVSPPDSVETPALSEAAPETDAPLEQMLRHLRLRRFSKAGDPTASDEAAALIESSELSAAEAAEADRESAAGDVVRAALAQVSAEMQTLAQEVRRVGREVFKTNRAAESYQETCTAALAEIEQLSAAVAQIPQQMDTALAEAVFERQCADQTIHRHRARHAADLCPGRSDLPDAQNDARSWRRVQKALKIEESAMCFLRIGLAYSECGKPRQALKYFDRAAELGDASVLLQIFIALLESDQILQAGKYADQALRKDPQHPLPHLMKTLSVVSQPFLIMFDPGLLDEARRELDEAEQLCQQQPETAFLLDFIRALKRDLKHTPAGLPPFGRLPGPDDDDFDDDDDWSGEDTGPMPPEVWRKMYR